MKLSAPPGRGSDNRSYDESSEGGSLLDAFYVVQKEGGTSQRLLCMFLIIVFAMFVRYCVGLGPYSGYDTPPMYGDFECQRHWMEMTYHLPRDQWYTEGPYNNLTYWGLDYPPLSGYWSCAWGALAHTINPTWVALHASHGIETPESKAFMRFTVLSSDLLLWLPVCILFAYIHHRRSDWAHKTTLIVGMIMCPSLIMVDHGHFQYNGVSLALALAGALLCTMSLPQPDADGESGDNETEDGQRVVEVYELMGAGCFVGSFMYKQMSLYFALPFFAFLLGKAVRYSDTWAIATSRVAAIGGAVITVVVLCVLPVASDMESVTALVKRIFPVGRGLYEDKVANIWCSISPAVKLMQLYSKNTLARLCMVSTLALAAPKCIHLVKNPTAKNFLVTLLNCSLAFFLVSYHVHEKSILLPVMPASALLLHYPLVSVLVNTYGFISIYPLIKREGSGLYLLAVAVIYLLAVQPLVWSHVDRLGEWSQRATHLLYLSAFGCVVLIGCDLAIPPPARLPDLWTLLITTYSCAHFVVIYLLTLLPDIPSPVCDGVPATGKKRI